ncbi:cytochrome b5-like heme/steroid binding domain-containing protein [Tessaracoccus sp. MC1756]|uniref:cytochrome b5-like heme/steroid binding domain-containing protein n=1 Tax=Tessaracoccus sp. MC1756 TaxID=2760311 RepID=UPI00160205B0|nr:cytochrome b5-like heme/steroid binding domain-containing protein [Tessaracoccus sp. MC1756]MBB1508308.1 cytochrome b5 domain-containing protein [Tessaracoccus sp. MC1756]
MLEDILGLPAHPLFVHLPVVLLPLSAVSIVALTLRPAWRPRFALPVLGLLALGALGAVAAWGTGDDLAAKVGLPVTHSELGMWTALASAVLLVAGGVWLWRVRRADPSSARGVFGWVVSALALVVLVLVTLTGHSGATAAWSGVAATAAAPGQSAYTMADVAAHSTPADCWIAVDGNAYDVSSWIPQHPGGPERIEPLCGTDATAQFTGQHGQTEVAQATLKTFLLGPLA